MLTCFNVQKTHYISNTVHQSFPNLSWRTPCPAYFVCLPNQTYPINFLQSLLTSWWVESGVLDKGDIQKVQGKGFSRTGLGSTAVHYCRSSMPRLSKTCSFPQSPSFQQAQYALIGQLAQCIVSDRTPQARVGNLIPLTIITSFSFKVSFVSSSPRGEQSRMTDTMMMLVFAVHKPRLRRCLTGCTFGRPNKVLLLSHRNTASPRHDCINTTAFTETTPSFLAWTFGAALC